MVKYSKECKEQALLLTDDIGVKKARFNCVNQILLPQLNVKFPNWKLAY